VENNEEEEGGEKKQSENRIFQRKFVYIKHVFHCISEVMQFAIDSNSSSLLELLYTAEDCNQKDMNTKKVEISFFVGSVEEISMSCILETCNVQCNTALMLL
jgi:hypothetical protein